MMSIIKDSIYITFICLFLTACGGGSADNIVNDDPIATDDSVTTTKASPVTIYALNNDNDADGDSLSISAYTQGVHGSVTQSGANFIYTPSSSFNDADSFTYTVIDGNGGADTATVIVTLLGQAGIFSEDWESGIDSSKWKSWGSPLPSIMSGEGRNGSQAFDPKGDANWQSGVTSYQNFDLSSLPTLDFWALGNSTQLYWQNLQVGWSTTTAAAYTGTEGQPGFAGGWIYLGIDNSKEFIRYQVGTEYFDEDWVDTEHNNLWMKYSIVTNPDGSFSFYRDEQLRWTSTATITLSDFTNQALVVHGRSRGAFQLVDDIDVNYATGNIESITYDGAGFTLTLHDSSEITGTVGTATSPYGLDNSYNIRSYVVGNVDNDPEDEVVFIANHSSEFAGQVYVVNQDGTEIGRYWNPGNIYDVILHDSDGDGVKEIYVGASNIDHLSNGISVPVIFALHAINMEGEAPPYSGTTGSGTELWYKVLDIINSAGIYQLEVTADGITGNTSVDGSGTAYIVSPTSTNIFPLAVDDSASTIEDSQVTIDVLANDSDSDSDALTISSFNQGTSGAVSQVGDEFIYTPSSNYNGSDSFTYTVSDGNGGSATATVNIIITTENDAPIATDDSVTTTQDSSVTISPLTNDSDADGDSLSISAYTQGVQGSVTQSGTNFIYTPSSSFNDADSFTYTVIDGNGGADTATVIVTLVSQATVFSEDWESGIDSSKWKSWGSPMPSIISGEGRNGSQALDPKGDANWQSGVTSYKNFNLSSLPTLEFWALGNSTQQYWQNLQVGWSTTTAAGYTGTEGQPGFAGGWIYLGIDNSKEFIRYQVGTEYFDEDWIDAEHNNLWMKYSIVTNPDGTYSFYRDEQLRWTSTETITLSDYTNQALVFHGRSYNALQMIDDISVVADINEAISIDPPTSGYNIE